MDNYALELYKQQYSNCIQRDFKDKTSQYLQDNAAEILATVKRAIETFFSELVRFQKRAPIEIGWITISLMTSSVYLKKPAFRLEAYDEGGVLGQKIHYRMVSADWLFRYWEDMQTTLIESRKKINKGFLVHEEQVRILMFECLDYLRNLFVAFLKYPLKDCEQLAGYKELILADEFRLSAGYHLDWQKVLFIKRPEVDIFFNHKKASLQHQKYNQKIYQNKVFCHFDLLGTRFKKCKFICCKFEDSNFSDCIFEECLLEEIEISNTKMYGVTFSDCKIKNVDFAKAAMYCVDNMPGELFKNPDFINCEINNPFSEEGAQ